MNKSLPIQLVIVVTGKHPSMTRSEVEFLIRKKGGLLANKVTMTTDILFDFSSDQNGAKNAKLEELNRQGHGIKRMTHSSFQFFIDEPEEFAQRFFQERLPGLAAAASLEDVVAAIIPAITRASKFQVSL